MGCFKKSVIRQISESMCKDVIKKGKTKEQKKKAKYIYHFSESIFLQQPHIAA